MATWKTLLLQDSASPVMEQLTFFHDHTLLILIIITILVGQMLISMLFNKFTNRFLLEGQLIEMIWTILPALILIIIALPSLRILYILDELYSPIPHLTDFVAPLVFEMTSQYIEKNSFCSFQNHHLS